MLSPFFDPKSKREEKREQIANKLTIAYDDNETKKYEWCFGVHGIRNDARRNGNIVIISSLFCIPNICFRTMTMYFLTSNKTMRVCTVHTESIGVSLLYLSNFYGIMRCHEPLDRQKGECTMYIPYFSSLAHPHLYVCVFGLFFCYCCCFSIHCIKLPKNGHWHIKGWIQTYFLPSISTFASYVRNDPWDYYPNEQYPPHMICMKSPINVKNDTVFWYT